MGARYCVWYVGGGRLAVSLTHPRIHTLPAVEYAAYPASQASECPDCGGIWTAFISILELDQLGQPGPRLPPSPPSLRPCAHYDCTTATP